MGVDEQERQRRADQARALTGQLSERGVAAVATTWVDNSGITRVKSVPLARLASAAQWGIGTSPTFDTFLLNDAIVGARFAGGPVGDLRLHPDLDRLAVLSAQPGWAWTPADRFDQQGEVHPLDQRSLARAAIARLAGEGYTMKSAVEVEWAVGLAGSDDFTPACTGPAYGFGRLVELSDYSRDVLLALGEQGVKVDQFHPEYAAGQLELSVAAEDPVGAADTYVLVRETIRAVSARHGLRASFSPKVEAEGVGNGGHLHLSLWRDDVNLFSGGDGQFGLTAEAEAFSAGILQRLPGLLAIGAPSVASYLRLLPQHWAGAYVVWGLENREAALRLVTGATGSQSWAANLEVKCFDQTANPYLLVAALVAAGLAGLSEKATLPEPCDLDPGSLTDEVRAERGIVALPTSLEEAVVAFESDPVFQAALGEATVATIADVRRGEIALFADASPDEIVAATRWRH